MGKLATAHLRVSGLFPGGCNENKTEDAKKETTVRSGDLRQIKLFVSNGKTDDIATVAAGKAVGESADKAVYLSVVAVGSDRGMKAEIDDTFAMLKDHAVELDESSKKENKYKVGGFDAEEMLFQGKDQDGPAAISITFVPIKDKVIVMTYWVTTAKEKKHLPEVGKIVNSLKSL